MGAGQQAVAMIAPENEFDCELVSVAEHWYVAICPALNMATFSGQAKKAAEGLAEAIAAVCAKAAKETTKPVKLGERKCLFIITLRAEVSSDLK